MIYTKQYKEQTGCKVAERERWTEVEMSTSWDYMSEHYDENFISEILCLLSFTINHTIPCASTSLSSNKDIPLSSHYAQLFSNCDWLNRRSAPSVYVFKIHLFKKSCQYHMFCSILLSSVICVTSAYSSMSI